MTTAKPADWLLAGAGFTPKICMPGRMRSVEHRKYSVRATREGVSAIVDSGGRARQRVEGPVIRAFAATVPWLTGATPFTEQGALGSYVLIGLSLAVWGVWRIREKSRGP